MTNDSNVTSTNTDNDSSHSWRRSAKQWYRYPRNEITLQIKRVDDQRINKLCLIEE